MIITQVYCRRLPNGHWCGRERRAIVWRASWLVRARHSRGVVRSPTRLGCTAWPFSVPAWSPALPDEGLAAACG